MKQGFTIIGMADVFQKLAHAILEDEEVTVVEFTEDEYMDFDEVGEFVASTLKGMKCNFEYEILEDKAIIKIYE
ncbi:hypothetical protein [Bacillus taeanensis]|uniref:Uncharacterized protein n=1 Tax=Bacillus taeanensis TaxID=273032 RepID=A0A366XR92_9BACI|nr:hypothetical protein [Bacillus taeanensis]RBW68226.1 hypothetical protein DS031_17775 [Bacillus taeanensis]